MIWSDSICECTHRTNRQNYLYRPAECLQHTHAHSRAQAVLRAPARRGVSRTPQPNSAAKLRAGGAISDRQKSGRSQASVFSTHSSSAIERVSETLAAGRALCASVWRTLCASAGREYKSERGQFMRPHLRNWLFCVKSRPSPARIFCYLNTPQNPT